MDKIYKNCGFGSCEHKGADHTHPFINEGDTKGFPVGGWDEDSDKPINYKLAATPNHPAARGRNTGDFNTGNTEAKIIPFPSRGQ